MADRQKLIDIFEELQARITTDAELAAAVRDSIAHQQMIPGGVALPTAQRHYAKTNVVVSAKRSLEAACAYAGKKTAVLNFASATNPGGGVTRGSSAQEECLCRCSTLYPCLATETMMRQFYQAHKAVLRTGRLSCLYNDDCIFTPNLSVVNADTQYPTALRAEERYSVDIITCAAPNLRERPSNAFNPDAGSSRVECSDEKLYELHVRRCRRILNIAALNGADVVILGAFGCGAFQNPPAIVAKAMRDAVWEYDGVFETVEFAVYCRPGDDENYRTFAEIIKW